MLDDGRLDPAQAAEIVRGLSEEELRAMVTDEVRPVVVDEIFSRFPDYLDPERTADVRETIGWDVEGDRRSVVIDRGSAGTRQGTDGARVTLALDTVHLLRLVTGNADAAVLFLTGALTITGDEAFALELATYFRAPAAGEIDPADVDADHMARVIRDVPEADLRERLRGGLRDAVLDEVFRRFPEYVDAERSRGVDAVLKWKITGREDGDADRFIVAIRDGECRAGRDLDAEPRVTIRVDAADFLKLVTGNANPMMAFMKGRLKIAGDLGFAAMLPRLFRMPSGT